MSLEFVDRSNDTIQKDLTNCLRMSCNRMSELSLTIDEEKFVRKNMPYLPPTYIDFLKGFRFDL